MIDWSRYPNFSEGEFVCHCGCGRAWMDPVFLDRLQALRTELEFPMRVTSGYRCPEHNAKVNGGPAHVLGKAADIAVGNPHALLAGAYANGFPGIGAKLHGPWSGRFVHLDILDTTEAPRPASWTYT